jgi:hypothetical protein
MSAEKDDPPQRDVRQDPGIPGTRAPDPRPDDESEPEQVPESEQPDVDDEGHMAPRRAEPEAR